MGFTRWDHVRNLYIKKQLNIEWDIVDTIQTRRLRYFGHVERTQPQRQPHQACKKIVVQFVDVHCSLNTPSSMSTADATAAHCLLLQ